MEGVPPKNQSFEVILGSSSMARRRILAEMGYSFTLMSADIDEKSIRKETPEDLVVALAEAKVDAILMKIKRDNQLKELSRPTLPITADTVVVYQGIIREKPSSEDEARQFIRDYSGGSASVVGSVLVHNLMTGRRKGGWESAEVVVYQGIIREKPSSEDEARQFIRDYSGGSASVVGSVLVHNLMTGRRKGGWESAEVYFLDIPDEVIDSLIEEGITFNVAVGLMLEHPLILPLVDTVVGSCDCVMGLSKTLTENLIREALF